MTSVKELLEAGTHFGHRTRRWNPKMAPFIFGERNGIYIIDLEKTISCLNSATKFIRSVVENGKDVLFVGTKKQAQGVVKEAAERCNMPYVTQRWLGGMLTNFDTVRKSINRLHSIEKLEETGDDQFFTKKEVSSFRKEKDKLRINLEGIERMRRLPGAIFVVDTIKENIAVQEGRKLGIPIVALLDTNSNPTLIDYPLPGNDDSARVIAIICKVISDTVLEAQEKYAKVQREEALKNQKDAEEPTAMEIDEAEIDKRLEIEEAELAKDDEEKI
jgi:small subunit ribosomal protein S2